MIKSTLCSLAIVLSMVVTGTTILDTGVVVAKEIDEEDIAETTIEVYVPDKGIEPLETYPTTDRLDSEIIIKNETTEETTEDPVHDEENVIVAPQYTDDDLFCLAVVVCREAGGASTEIQRLVANVVINRVNSSIYPDTIRGVITQRNQYGNLWKKAEIDFPKWAPQEVIDKCFDVAKYILDGNRVCPDNVLFQAEFSQGSGIFAQFPGYYFCYY